MAAAFGLSVGPPALADPTLKKVEFEPSPKEHRLTPTNSRSARQRAEVKSPSHIVTLAVDDNNLVQSKHISLVRERHTDGKPLATFAADTNGTVQLAWHNPTEESIEWTVERNGRVLGKTKDDFFTDNRDASETGDKTYEIRGSRTVRNEDGVFDEPFTFILSVQAVDPSPVGLSLEDPRALSSASNTDVMNASAGDDPLDPDHWEWFTQINTFIPTARAETPAGIQPCFEAYSIDGVGYFGGDDRGFTSSTDPYPSSRTGLELTGKNDRETGYSISESSDVYKWTSGTSLFNADGDLIAEADADVENGIKWVGAYGGEHGGTSTWAHSVGDPLCSLAPSINYELSMGAYGSGPGMFTLAGWHDQAPSFEYRVKVDGGAYNMQYTFENRGLEYLLPGAPKAKIDIAIRA